MSDELTVPLSLRTPPPQMIADLAYGMEEPVEIAYRYGYKASEFRQLEQHPPFLAAVAAARSELERAGHSVKVKAQWMTENLMDDLYIRAKSAHSSIGQIQDTIKILAKLADLEPRGNAAPVSSAPTSSVQIIFNNTGAEVVIGGETVAETKTPPVWDIPAEENE